MFTGIVAALGTIESMVDHGEAFRLKVASGKLDMTDVALGDSIATNGVCLTVVDFSQHHYSADVSAETIRLTGFANYSPGTQVNLEKAMQVGDRFGGHIVSGHVDGVGEVSAVITHSDYVEIWIKAPDDLARYIAHKGSITVDGVSLTVNKVNGSEFMLWIIPHTLQETVLGNYQSGTKVNLEVDVIARYLERLMLGDNAANKKSDISLEFLAEHGYLKK